MKKFRLILALSGFMALGLAGCGKAPSKPTPGGAQPIVGPNGEVLNPDGTPAVADDIPMEVSLASFEANMYEPLLKPFCASCHASTFVDSDVSKAHAAFLTRAGFNKFAGIDQTLPVLKMHQAHNCWDASVKTCVTMMTDKMNLWLLDLEAAGYKPKPVVYPNTTNEVELKTSQTPIKLTVPANYAPAGFTGLTATAPFTIATDDVDGAIGSYLIPAANTPPAAANATAPAANAPSQVITAAVTTPGNYFIWMRIKTPDAANSKFFVRATSGATVVNANFVSGVVTGGSWKWVQVMNTAGNNVTPSTINVAAAGNVPINIFVRDALARVNQVVLTTSSSFDGDQFSNSYFDIAVPLKVDGVEGAKVIATVWKATTGEGKKSLGVKSIKVASPVPLKVYGIYPLFNGIFSANNASYIDKGSKTVAVGTPEGAVIADNSSIWLTDYDTEKLSFSFEVLSK